MKCYLYQYVLWPMGEFVMFVCAPSCLLPIVKWYRWDLNPRQWRLQPKCSALDRSATTSHAHISQIIYYNNFYTQRRRTFSYRTSPGAGRFRIINVKSIILYPSCIFKKNNVNIVDVYYYDSWYALNTQETIQSGDFDSVCWL